MVILWGKDSHHELIESIPSGRIVPKVRYEKYPLIISHFNLDRVFVRIGMNEKQKRATYKDRRFTDTNRNVIAFDDQRNSAFLQDGRDHNQQSFVTNKVTRSDNFLN